MKLWTAIDRLLAIWKSDLSDKIKQEFFQAVAMSILLYRCTRWTLMKHREKKINRNVPRMLLSKIIEATPHKTASVRPLTSHLTNYPSKTNKTRCWRNKDELINDVLQWTPTYGHTSVGRTAKRYIYQLCADTGCNLEDLPREINDGNWWRERERESEKSVLLVWLDDD